MSQGRKDEENQLRTREVATEGGGRKRVMGPEGQVKNCLKNNWSSVSYAAERLAAKRAGELTFRLGKMEIINDLYESSCRQQWW